MNRTAQENKLFGAMALSVGLLTIEQLRTCAQPSDEAESLAEVLQRRKACSKEDTRAIFHLVARSLERHADSIDLSLRELNLSSEQLEFLESLDTIAEQSTHDGRSMMAADDTSPTQAWAPASPQEFSPRLIEGDRFAPIRLHAEGGLGAVFVAEDRELGRHVALKRMKSSVEQVGTNQRRFQFEAEVTGRLEHPNIVPVYSAGTNAEGAPYYAMRLVQGKSLAEAIREFHAAGGWQDPSQALVFRKLLGDLQSACNAVAYAHSRGVLHRDIKPENIMVGDFGETFVVDWGLAKRIDARGAEVEQGQQVFDASSPDAGTLQGAVAGTPQYMSPEQARGDNDQLGPASDVYSLGATLYVLLTGVMPFRSKSRESLLEAVIAGRRVPPREVNASIPRALSAICTKAMSNSPEDRYLTATQLSDDLERWLAGEPVQAWREPLNVRARRWMNRHRTVVVATAATLLMALIGLGGVVAVQSLANRALAETNEDLEVARDRALARADLAVGAVDRVRQSVAENLDVRNRPDLAPLRDSLLESPREFYVALRKDLIESGDTSPETRFRLAQVYLQLARLTEDIGSLESAVETYSESIAVLQMLVDQDPRNYEYVGLHARALFGRGVILYSAPELGDAEADFARALEIWQRLDSQANDLRYHQSLAEVSYQIGLLEQQRGNVEASITKLERALDLLDELLKSKHDNLDSPEALEARRMSLNIQSDLASLHFSRGQHADAVAIMEEAIPLALVLVDIEPDSLKHRVTLAQLYRMASDCMESAQDFQRMMEYANQSLELSRQLLAEHPTSHPLKFDLTISLNVMANHLYRTGDIAESLDISQEAITLSDELIADNPTSAKYLRAVSTSHLNIGNRYYMSGKKEEALAAFQATLPIVDQLIDVNPQNMENYRSRAGLYYNIGFLLGDLGKEDESLESYRNSLDLRRELAADFPDQPQLQNDVAFTLGNMARIMEQRNKIPEAVELTAEARDMQRLLVERYPQVLEYQSGLARSNRSLATGYMALGLLEEADESLTEAIRVQEQLVAADPATTQHHRDLGSAYRGMAMLLAAKREAESAYEAIEKSRLVLEAVSEEHPAEAPNQFQLGTTYAEAAEIYISFEAWQLTFESANRCIDTIDPLYRTAPDDVTCKFLLDAAQMVIARVKAHQGEVDSARDAYQAAMTYADAMENGVRSRFMEPLLMVWSGDHVAAAAAVDKLLQEHDDVETHYQAARVLAYAAAQVVDTPELFDRYGSQANEILAAEIQAGRLSPTRRARVLTGFDFAVLRARDDFPRPAAAAAQKP